jgi:uncharacterized protein (DUF1778 family)
MDDFLNLVPTVHYLSKEDFDRFVEILNNPPALTPALIELMKSTTPWDKNEREKSFE